MGFSVWFDAGTKEKELEMIIICLIVVIGWMVVLLKW